MNKSCQKYNLKNTSYTNPHGLMDIKSYSTCEDQAILSKILLKK